ncbi:MAG: hypothetical protein CL869_04005 [Cytophagia bacterium]|nr:hypothetical protein [Cytophagia bacterium]|tara:strand:+ start:1534 stop:2229 length:696 start_codon:yes stop_codon:yes gene_type:complete
MVNSLIISRFDENLKWLEDHQNFNIIIYNKGKNFTCKSLKNIINIDNVGRESHTWLYHIVENYNNLDDVSIFLQGRIDDLDCMSYKDPNIYLKKINKIGFAVSRLGLLGPLHWGHNVGIEHIPKYASQWNKNEISRSKYGFRKFAKKLFPEIPIFVATSYGGCFAVKKELILKYKVDFYKKLLETVSKHKNPIEGHYLERLWCYMFTKNSLLIDSFKDVVKTKLERSKLIK